MDQVYKLYRKMSTDEYIDTSRLGFKLTQNENRNCYKYTSDLFSITDILNNSISFSEEIYYSDNQFTLEQALSLIADSSLYDYFRNSITNIDDGMYIGDEYHNKTHAQRVCLYSFLMANYIGLPEKTIRTLISASLLHDIGRTIDVDDENHGYMGAKMIDDLSLFANNKEEKNLIQFLIECHALELNETIIAAKMHKYDIENNNLNITLLNILMDADALDRTRFTVFEEAASGLDPNYLRTPFSKNLIGLATLISNMYYNKDMILIKK